MTLSLRCTAQLCATIILLALLAPLAVGQTYSISVGGGTLSWPGSSTGGTCGQYNNVPYTDYKNGPFTFISSGGTTYNLGGSADYVYLSGGQQPNCPPPGPLPPVLPLGGPSYGFWIYFTAQNGGGGTATYQTISDWRTGYLSPRYVIVGITYAPPGSQSNVSYENNTYIGNTTKVTDSFQNGYSLSVSVSTSFGAWVPGSGDAAGFGVKVTNSDTTEWSQSSGTSNEVTLSKAKDVKFLTTGTGDAFAPVNHDYDIMWLWLNPQLIFSVDYNNSSNVRWEGYGYDNTDPAGRSGPDVVGIKVGCLNGHWSCPAENLALARTWVSPTITWPAGEGPGLTSSDIANILAADVLASGSYTLLNALPSTSSDGRFTQVDYPPNPLNYFQAGLGNGGGITTNYSTENVDSSIVGQSSDYKFSQSYGLETSFGGGGWFTRFVVTIKQQWSFSYEHTWQRTLTTRQTYTNTLSVTGPGCPQTSPPCIPTYVGPGQFIAYQDNLYGTFAFYPVPPWLLSVSVSPTNPSIAKGGTQPFTAIGNYNDNSTRDLTANLDWSSSNTSAATIPSRGVTIAATGVGAGSSVITASSGPTYTGSTTLTVTAPNLQSITVTPVNATIAKGATLQYTATGNYSDGSTQNLTNSASWASTNTGVATIAAGGLATGVAAGSANISATYSSVTGSTGLTVTGGSPAVSLSVVSLSFAKTVLGQTSAAKPVTLTNTGTATLNIFSVTISGDFAISSNTCGSQVAAGANCKVSVKFTPTAKGTRSGTLSFTDDAPGSPQTVSLTGTGTQIALSPTTLNFGTVTVGTTSASQTVTVTNVGTTAVTFTGITLTGTNSADYLIPSKTCGSTLAAGANCAVSVAFRPTAIGTRKATLNVADDGGGSPQTAALTGTGN